MKRLMRDFASDWDYYMGDFSLSFDDVVLIVTVVIVCLMFLGGAYACSTI